MFTRKNLLFVFIAIISFSLYAQNTIEDEIKESQQYLELFPDDIDEHLGLAYFYNLTGKADSAEAHYNKVIEIDSTQTGAWVGFLWTKSILGKNLEVLSYEKRALNITNNNSSIYNILAYSSGILDKQLSGVYFYQKALEDTTASDFETFLSFKGLATTYYWLSDYYRYRQIDDFINRQIPEEQRENLVPISYYAFLSGFYGKSSDKSIYKGLEFWNSYGALDAEFILENIRRDNKEIRTNYSLKLDNNFYPINLSSQFHFLEGVDKNLYNAQIVQIALSKNIYTYKSMLDLSLNCALSDYNKFHVQQYDLASSINFDNVFISATCSTIQINDYPLLNQKKNSLNQHYTYELFYKPAEFIAFHLLNGYGNQSFFVSPYVYIIDEYGASHQYHQLFVNFYSKLGILSTYYKIDYKKVAWQNTFNISLGVKY